MAQPVAQPVLGPGESRKPGLRWPLKRGQAPQPDLYQLSGQAGELLARLQAFHGASEDSAVFPSELLNQCEPLLCAPALFGSPVDFELEARVEVKVNHDNKDRWFPGKITPGSTLKTGPFYIKYDDGEMDSTQQPTPNVAVAKDSVRRVSRGFPSLDVKRDQNSGEIVLETPEQRRIRLGDNLDLDRDPLDPRQQIQPDAQLLQQATEGVFSLADRYNVNDRIAANFWLDANGDANGDATRRTTQRDVETWKGSYSLESAADELYCMQRDHVVEIIILLMKMRELSEVGDAPQDRPPLIGRIKHERVIEFTSRLLKNSPENGSIIHVLLDAILCDVKKNQQSKAPMFPGHVQKLALAVFHATYQLQVLPDEEEKLLRVIKELGTVVVDKQYQDDEDAAVREALHSVLVVLQVTYMNILSDGPFVDRDIGSDGRFGEEKNNNLYKDKAVSDKLFQKYELKVQGARPADDYIEEVVYRDLQMIKFGECSNPEQCKFRSAFWPKYFIGAYGLLYLVYGRALHFRSLYEDDQNPPISDGETSKQVKRFFEQGKLRRAYSYIRLCMLPILQTKNAFDSLNNSFALITQVLKAFLFDLSCIFVDEVYYDNQAVLDPNGNIPFFEVDPDRKGRGGVLRGGRSPRRRDDPTGQPDSLVDVTLLYTAFVSACTSFATQFLSTQDDQGNIEEQGPKLLVRKIIDFTHIYATRSSALRFLTALASSPDRIQQGANASRKVYDLLRQDNPFQPPQHFNWHSFSSKLWQLAQRSSKSHSDPTQAAFARFEAVDSWEELDPGSVARGFAEPSEITEEEEEEIKLIADLYAAIASQRDLLEVEEPFGNVNRRGADFLIETFFKLLSCQLAIETKGSIFRALAAYVRNCPDSQQNNVRYVWSMLIHGGFLPEFQKFRDALEWSRVVERVNKNNLRAELEDTESRTGVYLITDGFLLLVEALLTHDLIDAPDNKEVLVFLEYIVEDILGNIEERFYYDPQCEMRSSTSAQKWRVYARCFKVLSTILQHYPINILRYPLDLSKPPATVLASDFPDDYSGSGLGVLPFGNTNLVSTLDNIKSPGFMVMALLLSQDRNSLQDSVMRLLRCSSFAGSVRETDKINKEIAAVYAGQIMFDGRTKNNGFMESTDGVENLDRFVSKDSEPDRTYWHIKAVTAATGLLYECLLRENKFLERAKSVSTLSMTRIVRKNMLDKQPIRVQNLARVLAQYRYDDSDDSTITHLVELLQFPSSFSCSVPSVPIMACAVVKAVAHDSPNNIGLLSIGHTLVRGCAQALLEPNFPLPNDTGPLGALVFPRSLAPCGFDVFPDLYSEHALLRLPIQAPSASDVIERIKMAMRAARGDLAPRSFAPPMLSDLGDFETTTDCLLDLLITRLSPKAPCFAHNLLGLPALLLASLKTDDPLLDIKAIPLPGRYPVNCLEAVLNLMHDSCLLVIERPQQAMLCFELIYRLCASPITNLVVLSYLRRSVPGSGQKAFLPHHIEQCMTVLHKSDVELLRDCGFSDDGRDPEERAAVLAPIKCARLNCCAWLLKICALEFRAISISSVTVDNLVRTIRRPLFGMLNVMRQMHRGDHITLVSMLLAAADIPDANFPSFADVLRNLITHAQVPFTVARGEGIGKAGTKAQGFLVDKFLFNQWVVHEMLKPNPVSTINSTDFEMAEKGITLLNRYIQNVAAAVHLLEGWNQCVGMALFLHNPDMEDFERLVDSLILPTLQVLNSPDRLEAEMPELLASALFTMLSVLYTRVVEPDPGVGRRGEPHITQILDTHQQRRLLQGLINATVACAHREGTSARYSGYLIQCVGLVITGLSGFGEPSIVVSPNIREPAVVAGGVRRDEAWGGLREEDADTYRIQTQELLEQHVSQLVDAVGADVCVGAVASRLAAASTLQAILSVLGPAKSSSNRGHGPGGGMMLAAHGGRFKHVLGSHAFVQALQVLVHRGYLQQLLSIIGPVTGVRPALGVQAAPLGMDALSALDERELFISTVSLCVQLSCAVEGLDALVQQGHLLQRLLSLPFFVNPPPARDDIMHAAPDATCLEDWEDLFLVVLRLLRTLAATSPTRHVLEVCAEFLRKNNASVTYLLRLKHKSLYGLALLEAVMAIIAFVAAAPATPLHHSGQFAEGVRIEVRAPSQARWRAGNIVRDNKDGTFDVEFEDGLHEPRVAAANCRHCAADPTTAGILWDEVLEGLADSFSSDICRLVRVLGKFFPHRISVCACSFSRLNL